MLGECASACAWAEHVCPESRAIISTEIRAGSSGLMLRARVCAHTRAWAEHVCTESCAMISSEIIVGSSGQIFGERAHAHGGRKCVSDHLRSDFYRNHRLELGTDFRQAHTHARTRAEHVCPASRTMISTEIIVGSSVLMFGEHASARARGRTCISRVPCEDFYRNPRGELGSYVRRARACTGGPYLSRVP